MMFLNDQKKSKRFVTPAASPHLPHIAAFHDSSDTTLLSLALNADQVHATFSETNICWSIVMVLFSSRSSAISSDIPK